MVRRCGWVEAECRARVDESGSRPSRRPGAGANRVTALRARQAVHGELSGLIQHPAPVVRPTVTATFDVACVPPVAGRPCGVPKELVSIAVGRGSMDMADDVCFDHIIFQWLGDPSLHPELARLIGLAADKLGDRVGYLRVDTNAIRLTPARMDSLLDELPADGPPLLVVITIDAHTEPTYAHVKGVDALARVRRNVRHLIRARTRRQARLNLQFQFVVQEGNDHELAPFLQYWTDLLACQGDGPGDEVMFKRLGVGGGGPGRVADARYERALRRASRQPQRTSAGVCLGTSTVAAR